MTTLALRCSMLLAASVVPAAAKAQQPQEQEQVIIVTAPRSLPPPQRLIGRAEIDGYGAGSIGELIADVLAEEGENSPVVLINGRRASGLDELSDYPPEALQAVEVLSAGSGPSVGASPTRKIVNLVLQRRYDGRIGRVAVRSATEGGWGSGRIEANASRIRGDTRANLTLRARREGSLLETERDLVGAEPRALLPRVQAYDLSLSSARDLGADTDLSGTARLSLTDRSLALSGAGTRNSRIIGGRINATLNSAPAGWSVAALAALDLDRRTLRDGSASLLRSGSGTFDLNASRALLALPAGALQLNLNAGVAAERFAGREQRGANVARNRFSERSASLSAGLLVPIAGGPRQAIGALGELNLSADGGVTVVENGGRQRTGSLGLVWQPASWLRLAGALTRASTPPAARFRREAVVATPGVLLADPLTGESVRVTEFAGPLSGSTRTRSAQQRLGLTLTPDLGLGLRFESEWSRRRERGPVGALPLGSGAVLAAFPERFLRDPSGLLTGIDVSPVRFAARSESQWRNAINLRVPLGGGRNSDSGDDADDTPRAGSARLQLNLAHTLLMSSRLTLRDGLAPLDLLSRDGLQFAGGQPRHQLDAAANFAKPGMGLRLGFEWRSASTTFLTGTDGTDRLRFGALGIVSLRAFAEAERLFGRSVLTRGTRLTLNAANLFAAREQVRDALGATPLAYQPATRDPLGRTIELELRRRF